MIKQWAMAILLSTILVFGAFALFIWIPGVFILLTIVGLIYMCALTIKDALFPRG